jgi:hypothetical protein
MLQFPEFGRVLIIPTNELYRAKLHMQKCSPLQSSFAKKGLVCWPYLERICRWRWFDANIANKPTITFARWEPQVFGLASRGMPSVRLIVMNINNHSRMTSGYSPRAENHLPRSHPHPSQPDDGKCSPKTRNQSRTRSIQLCELELDAGTWDSFLVNWGCQSVLFLAMKHL